MTAQALGYRIRYRRRTDWFRVLVDLRHHGKDHAWVATVLDVPESTIKGWKAGSEPAHAYGHALLELWSEVLGKPISARPMTQDA